MAITRLTHRIQARQLRSGFCLAVTPNAISSPPHRASKSRQHPKPVKERKGADRRSTHSQQVDQLRGSCVDDFQSLLHNTPALDEEQRIACDASGTGHRLHPSCPVSHCDTLNLLDETSLVLSLPTCDQPLPDVEIGRPAVVPREEGVANDPISLQELFLFSLEDAGLPHDGFWDITAAYDINYCVHHDETEYLLGTANRWISPDDLDVPNAESLLEEELQKFELQKAEGSLPSFDPHLPRNQAGCSDTLSSHIYRVVHKHEHDGRVWYLVEWRACWTPESKIGDMSWIPESLAANQKSQHWRRSARLKENFESRKKTYQRMASVVNLDC
ncbi:uncharacterized protein Z519_12735 [Cladophialophora bantiana CBS 173.52]|uniref:Chromo domain-containing protein n=1 Tax=Cladophialophora bantiana (strain ATCC 10958 / CBS 173.52 / CDC B-1940 / NIH 8579) TaxID=1442370 RepID=A0A0D2H728_CLAB1|nr:uncharacterized protein Z519_12735 [Cladophialophora bantiana CBS 173.52]KIW86680.1 hypothetical protein Z519_12735 [Cladophialophora bantiana CBS 173.52]